MPIAPKISKNRWVALLEDSSPSLQLFRPIWFEAWDAAYRDQGSWSETIHYLYSENADTTDFILPFSFQKVGPFRFASLAGYYLPFRNIPFRLEATNIVQEIVNSLTQLKQLSGLRIGPVQASSQVAKILYAELPCARWKILKRQIGTEYILNLPASEDEFIFNLNKKGRKNLKYYWNKLNRLGTVKLRVITNVSENTWSEVFRNLAHIESKAWVGTSGEPRFYGERNQKFWNLLTSDPWMLTAIRVWVIYLNDNPVSFVLTIDSGQVRYVIANSYDEAVAEYSTGSKLYYEMIRDAINCDLESVNFGIGDSGYKTRWKAEGKSNLIDIIAFPNTARGRIAYVTAWFQNRIKTMLDHYR